jgi:hypothetical protein
MDQHSLMRARQTLRRPDDCHVFVIILRLYKREGSLIDVHVAPGVRFAWLLTVERWVRGLEGGINGVFNNVASGGKARHAVASNRSVQKSTKIVSRGATSLWQAQQFLKQLLRQPFPSIYRKL